MRAKRSYLIALSACSLLTQLSVRVASAAPTHDSAVVRANGAALAAQPAPAAAREQNKVAAAPAIGPEEHARRVQHALKGLESSDPVEIQEALRSLHELTGRAAAEGIAARLKSGLPPQLCELALSALGALNQPIAAPVLSELTLHRRWQIRAQALAALASLRVRSSVSVLLFALDDPSAQVRSAAARALGLLGDPRASTALRAALERGVEGALEGLAHLSTSKQVDNILMHARSDLKAAEPALWILLARPNLPVVTKLKVIELVNGHDAEQEAAVLRAGWQEKLKASGDTRLLSALSTQPGATTKPKIQVVAIPVAQAALTPVAARAAEGALRPGVGGAK